MEEKLRDLISGITPSDRRAAKASLDQWDSIAKPLGSLGAFEDIVIKMAALKGSPEIYLNRPILTVFCSDNGVVEEGISQSGQEVTQNVMRALALKESTVSFMAREAGCEVLPVDVGVRSCVKDPGSSETGDLGEIFSKDRKDAERILDRRIKNGTENIARTSAMTREECIRAIICGIELVSDLKKLSFDMILTGEMGIGNTTTSAAVAAALSGKDPSFFVGRGAGLSDDMLLHKKEVVSRAVALHKPDPKDVIGVLSRLGGADIAAMCGVFLGGAIERIPVIMDGYISSVAALCACRLNPLCEKAIFASHLTAEQGGSIILDEIEKRAVIYADMRLGEGGGAVMLLPLLRMALSVYHSNHSFQALGIEPYRRFEDA